MKGTLLYIAAANIFAFVLCGADKWKAIHGAWRVPEKALFLSAIIGGSLGLLLGMRVFHHKTLHRSFTVGVPLILMFQVALVLLLVVRGGPDF